MYIICGLIFICFVIIDQVVKIVVVDNLMGNPSVEVIRNFFYLTYVENRGAAFGILQDKKILFIIATVILCFILIYCVLINKKTSKLAKLASTLILSGAIGNFIDRMLKGYVVDFLDFRFGSYNYPVFNIADCCIVVGVILMAIVLIFNKYDVKVEEKSE